MIVYRPLVLLAAIAAPRRKRRKEVVNPGKRPPAWPFASGKVFFDRQRAEDQPLLRYERQTQERPPVDRQRTDIAPLKADRAAMQPRMPHNRGEERRLAGAIAAKHRQGRTGRERE